MAVAVDARALSARRGTFHLEVDAFEADAGGTALLGHNGAGKSTLLLALQGLLPCGGSIDRPGRCAGVFSAPAVLHGSVSWNVAIVARFAIGLDESEARRRAEAMLERVGLTAMANRNAMKLSSGQRQRLALARALAIEPQALFLDEPFAHVDAEGRPALRDLVAAYVARSGCALVLATANLADALALCTRAIVLDGGRAVERFDAVAQVAASRSPYLRALVAESSFPIK